MAKRDELDREFEAMYRAFVAAGGLDTTRVLGEDFERMLRRTQDPARLEQRRQERCIHGLTYLTCAYCYLHFTQG